MYHPHPLFVQPESEAVKVWRYMDFTKFVSLIDSRRLFFSRADELGDPFEGSLPRADFVRQQTLAQLRSDAQEAMTKSSDIHKESLKYVAINCWHMNNPESAAMWKLYLKSNEGIAVQSSYTNLRDSIIDDEKVCLGVVSYIDYENEQIEDVYLLAPLEAPFVFKRKSFDLLTGQS